MRMAEIRIVIDGTEVIGHEGMTILEAAEKAGIKIPTLCHKPDLSPSGNCRICVVEVEGSPRLVGSCHTPITHGMVVHTRSPKVIATRKVNIELLMTAHTGSCVTDMDARECELHQLASELEVGPPRFKVREPRNYPIEEISPYVTRDMSKCILCTRCIRACNEIAKKDIFSMAYRGFSSKVIVDCDVALNKEACKDCGICIEYCPTGALTKPRKGVA
jgi:NADH dehydrogenase/NADH:ubiquinone oxidoreductase subunit G